MSVPLVMQVSFSSFIEFRYYLFIFKTLQWRTLTRSDMNSMETKLLKFCPEK